MCAPIIGQMHRTHNLGRFVPPKPGQTHGVEFTSYIPIATASGNDRIVTGYLW